MTGPRKRGSRTHRVTDVGGFNYPWSRQNPPTTDWICSCKATGSGQDAAERHLTQAAKAAWKRLDKPHAMAAALVGRSAQDAAAIRLLWSTPAWRDHDGIHKHFQPYYDSYGHITAALNWPAVLADVTTGRIAGDANDLLVLRVILSLAGLDVPLNLARLELLPEDDVRRVRDALLKLLRFDGEE